jgi:uncharacterized protein YndB with AHSA1/START domain
MTGSFNPELDLTISRIIPASRAQVWDAWADPRNLEQWWVPAPGLCKVITLELRAGGSFLTEYSEGAGKPFGPHIDGCFLAVDHEKRIVFTDTLTGGWRPSKQPFMTAVISFRDHPKGTEYHAYAMHKSAADRKSHADMGFDDGWGTVADQLAKFVEARRR